jgi:hypothetical protein
MVEYFSPDGSGNPFLRKTIFSGICRTTKGSSCKFRRKKVFGEKDCNVQQDWLQK